MKTFLIATLLLLSQNAFAASAGNVLPEDNTKIGKKGSSADKIVEFELGQGAANPKLKGNKATNRIQFSQDGTNFKDVGSGAGSGGGGLNLLSEGNANPDAEQGTIGHTASGGTFTAVAASPVQPNDAKHFQFVPSAGGQTVTTSQVAVTERLKGQNCSTQINYKTTEATNLYILNAINGSSTVLSTTTLASTSGNWQKSPIIYFACPSGTDTVALQIKAAASTPGANIQWDDEYTGELAMASLSQASFVGSATFPATASCSWSTTSTSFVDFSANASCTLPAGGNLQGAASAPATKIPAITFANGLDKGRYYIVATGSFRKDSTANESTWMRFSDGTNATTANLIFNSAAAGSAPSIIGELTYSTAQAGPLTIRMQGKSQAGTANPNIEGGANDLTISVYRYPSASEVAMRFDSVPATWSGYHTGSWTSTSTSFADFGAGTSVVLTARQTRGLVCSTASGSLPGITCSVNRAGLYRVCAAGQVQNSAAANFTAIRLIDGNSNVLSAANAFTNSGGSYWGPFSVCGDLNATSVGSQTIKVQAAEQAAGTITLNTIVTGQSTIEWNVVNLDVSVPFPYTINALTTGALNIERIESAKILNNGACSITSQSGSWLSSVAWTATGRCTINIASGMFSAVPRCTCTHNGSIADAAACQIINDETTTVLHTYTSANSTGGNVGFNLMCMGPK